MYTEVKARHDKKTEEEQKQGIILETRHEGKTEIFVTCWKVRQTDRSDELLTFHFPTIPVFPFFRLSLTSSSGFRDSYVLPFFSL